MEIVEKLEIIDCWAGVQLKSGDALSTAEESEIHFIGGREQKYKRQQNTFVHDVAMTPQKTDLVIINQKSGGEARRAHVALEHVCQHRSGDIKEG